MNSYTPQVLPNIPLPQTPKAFSPSKEFANEISKVMTLANTGKLGLSQGSSLKDMLVSKDISDSDKEKLKQDYLSKSLQPILSKDIRSGDDIAYSNIEPYANSMDFKKLGFEPFANNEDRYINNRSFWNSSSKIFNKFATSTGVGAASALTPIFGQNLSDRLTNWQQKMDEYNKIFYTQKENESNYNPLTTKFYDNLLPSLGFTLGNMAASVLLTKGVGGIVSKGLSGIAKLQKVEGVINAVEGGKLGAYKWIKNVDKADDILGSINAQAETIQGATNAMKGLGKVTDLAYKTSKFLSKRLPYSIYSGMAESHIEASMARQETLKSLEDGFTKKNKRNPNADELLQMAKIADDVYDKTLTNGTILLSATNLFEIDALMSKFGMAGKLLNIPKSKFLGGAFHFDDIIFRGGAVKGWEKKKMKELILPALTSTVLDGLAEGFEEGSQYMIANGIQSWAIQKFKNKDFEDVKNGFFTNIFHDIKDPASFILSKNNMDDEFTQNAVFGALSGMLMSSGTKFAINPIKNKITKAPDLAQKRVDLLNKANDFLSMKFVGAHEDKLNYFNQNAEILKHAIENDDIFAIKNIQHSDLYTWVATSIAAGGFDLRLEQLEDLKNLQGEEFENFFSLKYNEENKALAKNYIDSIKNKGEDIASDIEKFREIENIYKWTDKEDKDLTEEEKTENDNFELFEGVKYDLSYYYSKIKNFDKRSSKMLSELESSLGSTNLFSTIKNIAFSNNIIEDYKKNLENSILSLKQELKSLESPSGIFLQQYKDKIQLINKKQVVLNQINAVKEDFEKYVEDNADKLTEEQKQNVAKMSSRNRDLNAIAMIIEHEIDSLNFDFKISLGEKDILDKKTLLKELLPIASDLFTVTQNKQIVLNKFDKLNTRKGKHEFIQNLKKAKEQFEGNKSVTEISQDDFLKELKAEYVSKGYPEDAQVMGLELTFFTDSKDSIEEDVNAFEALIQNKEKAKELISLITEEKDGKTISYYTTEFDILNDKIEIKGESKEKVEKKIDELFEKVKSDKLKKETTGKFIIQRIKKPLEKNADGKLVTPITYTIVSEFGTPIFKNRELTNEEIKGFLKGIKNISNINIRKYEVLSFQEFKQLNIKVNQLKDASKKLESLGERMFVVNEQLKEATEKLNSDIFKDLLNSPLNDFLDSQYITLYSIQGSIKKAENKRKELLQQQKEFSLNYKNSKNTNKGWQNTNQNKNFISQLKEIENQLLELKTLMDSIEKSILKETSRSEEMAMYYSKYRNILETYNNLIDEKNLLIKFKNELINNYNEIVEEKTTKVINFKDRVKEKEDQLFGELTEVNKEKIIKKLEDIVQKEKEIMTIQTLFIEQHKAIKKQISDTQQQIQNIRNTIDSLEESVNYMDLVSLYDEIDKLNRDTEGLERILNNLEDKINFNNNSIKNYGSEFEKSVIDDFKELKLLEQTVSNVSKALSFRDSKLRDEALNGTKGELFNSYNAQRKVTFFGGEEQDMELEAVSYDYSGKRYKPNSFIQGTGRDITTQSNEDGTHIIPSKEEINSNPSIEFYRFLASQDSEDIINDFDVMLITPKFLDLHSDKQIFKDLSDHIFKQYENPSDIDVENDIFQVIVEKGTNKPIFINNQFLTSSLYKPNTKFSTTIDGSLKNITEKAVLQLFKTSEHYAKEIENKSEEEINEYLKDSDTLKQAIKFAKEEYSKELQLLKDKINSLENKVIISNIENVTNGIFIRNKRQSIPAILNKSTTSIGIAIEEGLITYRDDNGIQEIQANVAPGTVVAVDKQTKKWIPVETRTNNQTEVEEILGILDFTIHQAEEKNKSIHEICNNEEIKFSDDQFQLFFNQDKKKKVEGIPLYPRFGVPFSTGDNKRDNWFRRWSVMTTYFNFGYDKKNPKNTFYFTHRDDLSFYNSEIGKSEFVSKEKLKKLLEAWFSNTTELLSESDKATLDAIVKHIKNKKRNISAQYALFSDSKFLLPKYDQKTRKFTFKMYDSYSDYVFGDKSLDSGLVTTTVQKVDDRFNFQQSLILSKGMKIFTNEFSIPENTSNGIVQQEKEEKPEVKSIPSKSTEKPVLKLDISKTNPETDVDINKISISIVNGGIFANEENIYSFDRDSGAKFIIYREELTDKKNALKAFDKIIELRKEILSLRPQNNEEKLNLDFKASKLRRDYSNLLYFLILSKNKNNEIQLTNDELFNQQISEIGELRTIETYNNIVLTFKKAQNTPFGALYYFVNNKNEEVYLVGDRLKSALDNGTIKKVEIISDKSNDLEIKKIDYKVLETFLPTGSNLEYTIRIQNNKTGEKASYTIDNTGRWVVATYDNKNNDYVIVNKPLSQEQIINSAKVALGEDFVNKLNSIKSETDKVIDIKGGEKFEKFLELLKKYDAELVVLENDNKIDEKTLEGFLSERETANVFKNELDLFKELKEKNEPELEKYETLEELMNDNNPKIKGAIKHLKGIKNYLIKLLEKNSVDSLNELTVEKILKDNPNIKKSC